mmetsp:Transcript_3179/g.3540  ORF Transcript_3179/g.3540 Transcript_3179/m.3540 type:complete len:93 (+) Transcript_3179:1-279(+)
MRLKCTCTQVTTLDDYEDKRPPRRDEIEMYMPEYLRRWKLLERGVSMKEIHKATKDANRARKQRNNSIQPRTNCLVDLKSRVKKLIYLHKKF